MEHVVQITQDLINDLSLNSVQMKIYGMSESKKVVVETQGNQDYGADTEGAPSERQLQRQGTSTLTPSGATSSGDAPKDVKDLEDRLRQMQEREKALLAQLAKAKNSGEGNKNSCCTIF